MLHARGNIWSGGAIKVWIKRKLLTRRLYGLCLSRSFVWNGVSVNSAMSLTCSFGNGSYHDRRDRHEETADGSDVRQDLRPRSGFAWENALEVHLRSQQLTSITTFHTTIIRKRSHYPMTRRKICGQHLGPDIDDLTISTKFFTISFSGCDFYLFRSTFRR